MEEKTAGHRREPDGRRSRLLLPLAGIAALAVLTAGTYALIEVRAGTAEPVGQEQREEAPADPPTSAAGLPGTAGPAGGTADTAPSTTPATRPPVTKPPGTSTRAARRTGWPDASTTGVPKGTKLRRSGSLTIKNAGTVVDRMDVNGCILVLADDVTIRRTRVRGETCGADHGIDIGYGGVQEHRGILIEDVEVDGQNRHARGAGIGNSGFTCRRCNVHGHARGIQTGSDVVVEDSYLHDLHGTQTSETAPFQTNGGSNLVIRRSRLEQNDLPTASTALALIGEYQPIDNVLVEGNLFNGGGYCVYGGSIGDKKYPVATRTRFLNNAFGRQEHRRCGSFGPVAFFSPAGRGNRWSGNYWLDTKKPVGPG